MQRGLSAGAIVLCSLILILILISGCTTTDTTDTAESPAATVTSPPVSTDSPPATDTSQPVATDAPTAIVTPVDDCIVPASIERGTQRTLPNGRPFPGNPPRQIDLNQANQSARQNMQTILVKFTDDSSMGERNQLIQGAGGNARRRIDGLSTYVVRINSSRPGAAPMNTLRNSAIVEYIETDTLAAAQQINPPNDPRYSEQWALPVVGLPEAWQNVNAQQRVTVAVIDSGVCLNHPDLQGRFVPGYDFVEEDNIPQDVFGHGCGVAGVIAANSNNALGIAGAAPNVQIMPLRVLDETGLGGYANISAAIVYAADNGAEIINLSLGAFSPSQILEEAVNYALARGVILVASAGNYGQEGALYPAAYDGVLSVGSVDPDLNRSDFSHYGTTVDVYAPGRDILTTSITGDYEMQTGTSFSAPLVSALTAIQQDINSPLATGDNDIAFVPSPGINPCE